MDIVEYREFCLSLPGAVECTPFGPDTLVFKVGSDPRGEGGKMFSYAGMEGFHRFCVKCDPALAIELRERHPEITRGIHSNSAHWNTVRTDGDLTDGFLREQIQGSYDLVVAGMTRAARAALAEAIAAAPAAPATE